MSATIPAGINPIATTLRKADPRDRIKDLAVTFEYLLNLHDSRKFDDDGESLTLKPKARANAHLFSSPGALFEAIDVRNAIVHPEGHRPQPPDSLMSKAQDSFLAGIDALLPHAPSAIVAALCNDPHEHATAVPLEEIRRIPDLIGRLIALRDALESHLAYIDAQSEAPAYERIPGSSAPKLVQRVRRHHHRFIGLSMTAIAEAIEVAESLCSDRHEAESRLTLDQMHRATLPLVAAIELLERELDRPEPTGKSANGQKSDLSDPGASSNELRDKYSNGDMTVEIPFWTDFVVKVKTRQILLVMLILFVLSVTLAAMLAYSWINKDPDTIRLARLNDDQRFAQVQSEVIAANRARLSTALDLVRIGDVRIPVEAESHLRELRRAEQSLKTFDDEYAHLLQLLSTEDLSSDHVRADLRSRIQSIESEEVIAGLSLQDAMESARRHRRDLDRILSNVRTAERLAEDNRRSLLRMLGDWSREIDLLAERLRRPYTGPSLPELTDLQVDLAQHRESIARYEFEVQRLHTSIFHANDQQLAVDSVWRQRIQELKGSGISGLPAWESLSERADKTYADFWAIATAAAAEHHAALLARRASLETRARTLGLAIADLMDVCIMGYDVDTPNFKQERAQLEEIRLRSRDLAEQVTTVWQTVQRSTVVLTESDLDRIANDLSRLESSWQSERKALNAQASRLASSLRSQGMAAADAFAERRQLLTQAEYVARWGFWGTSLTGETKFFGVQALRSGLQLPSLSADEVQKHVARTRQYTIRYVYEVDADLYEWVSNSPEGHWVGDNRHDGEAQHLGGSRRGRRVQSLRADRNLALPEQFASYFIARLNWQNKNVFLYSRTEGHYHEKRKEMKKALIDSINREFPTLRLQDEEVALEWVPGRSKAIIEENLFNEGGIRIRFANPEPPAGLKPEGDHRFRAESEQFRTLFR